MKLCLCSVPWRSSGGRFGVAGYLGESGQEAPSSFRTDGETSSLPAGVPWELAMRAVPTLPISPMKWRKGQPIAVLIRGPVVLVVHTVPPSENHH